MLNDILWCCLSLADASPVEAAEQFLSATEIRVLSPADQAEWTSRFLLAHLISTDETDSVHALQDALRSGLTDEAWSIVCGNLAERAHHLDILFEDLSALTERPSPKRQAEFLLSVLLDD